MKETKLMPNYMRFTGNVVRVELSRDPDWLGGKGDLEIRFADHNGRHTVVSIFTENPLRVLTALESLRGLADKDRLPDGSFTATVTVTN